MGASGWSYYVAYQPDLNAALKQLRRKVFDEGDYHWAGTGPRPQSMRDLFEVEAVRFDGTHSILDMFQVIAPEEELGYGKILPVEPDEALRLVGTERPTRAHVWALEKLRYERWQGRCAVLHGADGEPEELYFWGASGD